MSSIIRRRSGLTVLVSLMESSFLIEASEHLDSHDRGSPLLPLLYTLTWLPASRLLPPRSGLERSDFVLWPITAKTSLRLPVAVGDKPDLAYTGHGGFDPDVWSGRALQEVFSSIRQIRS